MKLILPTDQLGCSTPLGFVENSLFRNEQPGGGSSANNAAFFPKQLQTLCSLVLSPIVSRYIHSTSMPPWILPISTRLEELHIWPRYW